MLRELDMNDTGDVDFSELIAWYQRRMQVRAQAAAPPAARGAPGGARSSRLAQRTPHNPPPSQEFAEYEAKRRQNRSRMRVIWEDEMKLPKRVKVAIAWVVNWAMFAVFALLATVLAVGFGEERFNAIITSWAVSLGQTFGAEEPVMIWIYLLIPWLVESFSNSEFLSELLASFMGTAVGRCVSSVLGFCANVVR
jgi:hypothetical protein